MLSSSSGASSSSGESSSSSALARDCAEHAAPAQNPYIETSSSSGSNPPAAARGTDAGNAASAALAVLGDSSTRRISRTADGTGPPLWLSTCVSRT